MSKKRLEMLRLEVKRAINNAILRVHIIKLLGGPEGLRSLDRPVMSRSLYLAELRAHLSFPSCPIDQLIEASASIEWRL